MNAEITDEIEFLTDLRRQCQFARRSKAKPGLAIPAARWEMKINTRLAELESEQRKQEQEQQAHAA